VGAYDVTLDTGPGYATRRQEAQDGMKAFLQAFPEAAPVIGDLYAKGQDWQYADEISQRLQAVLPPQIKAMIEKDKLAENPDAEPDPQKIKEEQQADQQAQIQQMQIAAGVKELEAKTRQAIANAEKAEADAQRAKVELMKAMQPEPAEPMEQPEQVDPIERLGKEIEVTDKAHDFEHKKRMREMELMHSQADLQAKAENQQMAMAEKNAPPEEAKEPEKKDNTAADISKVVETVSKSQTESLLAAIKEMNRPKRIVRGKDGKPSHVETM